jgi:hypothetical protein
MVITVRGNVTIDTEDVTWKRVMKQIIKEPLTGLESKSEIEAKAGLVIREVIKTGISRLGCPNPLEFKAHYDGEEYVLFGRYRAGEWIDIWRSREVELIREQIEDWPFEQREPAFEALSKIHHKLN